MPSREFSQLTPRGLSVTVLDGVGAVSAAQAVGLLVGSSVLQWLELGLSAQAAPQQCGQRDGHLIPVT